MNRQQKIAFYLLVSLSVAMILGVIGFMVHRFDTGSPRPFIFLASGAICIGVFLCFISKKDMGTVASDEREELIKKNAFLAGLGAVYLLMILVSLLPVAIAPKAKVSTQWFPFLLPSAVLLQAYVQSIAFLIQYGWRKKGEAS